MFLLIQDSEGQGCPFCRAEIKGTEQIIVDPFDPQKQLRPRSGVVPTATSALLTLNNTLNNTATAEAVNNNHPQHHVYYQQQQQQQHPSFLIDMEEEEEVHNNID